MPAARHSASACSYRHQADLGPSLGDLAGSKLRMRRDAVGRAAAVDLAMALVEVAVGNGHVAACLEGVGNLVSVTDDVGRMSLSHRTCLSCRSIGRDSPYMMIHTCHIWNLVHEYPKTGGTSHPGHRVYDWPLCDRVQRRDL